jgi:hypothetical protein
MRAVAVIGVFVAFAASSVASAAAPAVPVRSEHAIAQRTPTYGYVPARIALGFRYRLWSFESNPPALQVVFRNAAGRTIEFTAAPGKQCDGSGREKTFQLDGNKVYWAETDAGQQAWRCVVGRGSKPIRLTASTTLPPAKFADSGLGQVAAAGRRAR